ncbi:glycosyltransferase [Nocardioides aequoreus]|uniref:glycosyltransferase n=1 Tax=Nocardioides aequoreus TaxID=397278 RepID=UPI0004C35DE6|nr:glycosyltransferase [Nocardioides aequoreus]
MSASLRVCLVASARFPVREPFMGGLEAQTHALATSLRNHGHEVTLFAAPGSDPELGVHELPVATYAPSPVARRDVGAPPAQWMQEHHAYLDLMLGLADGRHGPFDVVHDNSLHHLPVAMSRSLDVPVVSTLHTPPVPWLESAAVLDDGHVHFVAVSHYLADAWRDSVSAAVVRNGVDTDFWAEGPGGRTLVWTGRLVPEKAPHEAVLAARRADMDLALVGPLHDAAYFEREVRPLLDDRRRYLGHASARQVRELLQHAAAALVTPAWDEPFGLVAAEAMSCGTPVAAYARGALPELVAEGTGVLATAGDVDALAQAARRASELDRRPARQHAVEHFSITRMVAEYETVYHRVRRRAAA